MSVTPTSSSIHETPGTVDRHNSPFQQSDQGSLLQYATITCQEGFRAFSLEEHRLADYGQGVADRSANADSQLPLTFSTGLGNRSPRADRRKLDLFRGSAIAIHVGTPVSSNESMKASVSNKWSLPKNLISHYSPFLQAACSLDLKEKRDERIELPEEDPTVFGLFVEWMYYGSYDILPLTSHYSIDAQCWVLGDRLLCGEFKNYALSRLYERHIGTPFSRAVSCDDVQYAWDNTVSLSKLRQFYVDFVIQNFESPGKLLGTTEDWDSILQSHSDIRVLLLENFRKEPSSRIHIKEAKEYLELDTAHLDPRLNLSKRAARLAVREKREESWDLSVVCKVVEKDGDDAYGRMTRCTETKTVPAAVGSCAEVHGAGQEPFLETESEPIREPSRDRGVEDTGCGSDEFTSSPCD